MNNLRNTYTRFLKKSSDIIVNRKLLDSRHPTDIVVARDNQMAEMGDLLAPISANGDPYNMYIWGDTGVGKTITVKYLLKALSEGLKQDNMDTLVERIIVNCTAHTSEIPICIDILSQLTGIEVPFGKQIYQYLNDIWSAIDKKASEHNNYVVIIFLDEIDVVTSPDNLLYQLTRASPDEKIKSNNASIGIILASNQKNFLETLNDKVRSSGNFKYIDFPDYNKDELYEILQLRKEAFVDGVVSDDVIMCCAESIADRYHGDARRAIDTLAEAARIVEGNKGSKVTCADIDLAEKAVNAKVTIDMLKAISLHDKYLMLAAYLADGIIKENKFKSALHMGIIKATYYMICKILDKKPSAETYLSTRLSSLEKKQLLETSYCPGHGNCRYVYISDDIASVIEQLFTISDMEKIKDNYADIESVVMSKVKKATVKHMQSELF